MASGSSLRIPSKFIAPQDKPAPKNFIIDSVFQVFTYLATCEKVFRCIYAIEKLLKQPYTGLLHTYLS